MSQLALDLEIETADREPSRYLDTTRYGFFSVLHSPRASAKKQNSYPLNRLAWVIEHIDPTRDCWISQAEFIRPNRRVVNLARIGLCFVDLDTYRTDLEWMTPEGLCFALLDYCHSEGIPQPSIVIFSGRGLQVKWLYDKTIPRQALPRWNACQRVLVEKLSRFGSDPAAKDASRVLRLVNTVNTKSGEICRVIHASDHRYDFEYLAESLLPVRRDEIRLPKQRMRAVTGGWVGNLKPLQSNGLAWDRLEDLRKLVLMRGGIKEGERMLHLHWQLNFLLLSGATNANLMYHEARSLAREMDPYWSYQKGELSTLYQKAKSYNAGEKVEFSGRTYPALYTPKNDTLINLFRIIDDEQEQLKTIITPAMALDRRRERDRKRDEERRRTAGAVTRDEYISRTKKIGLREQVLQLQEKGFSQRKIAKEIGISQQRVSTVLKG